MKKETLFAITREPATKKVLKSIYNNQKKKKMSTRKAISLKNNLTLSVVTKRVSFLRREGILGVIDKKTKQNRIAPGNIYIHQDIFNLVQKNERIL